MTSGLAKQIGHSNGYTMQDQTEVIKCPHCHRDFRRLKTIRFAIIACPYSDCQGPNYTGDISNSAKRFQFEQAVLTYQSKKGMNPPPGLENLHYHQQVHVSVPLEPSTPRAPSTQERNEARGSSLRLHVSKTQTRNNVADLQGNTTQDWAECIRKLVCQQVSEETEGLQRQIKSLQETIDAQQEKIDQNIGEIPGQANQELLKRLDRLEEQLEHQHRERLTTQQQIYRYKRQILDLSEQLAKISQIQQKHEALLDKPVAVSDVSKPEPNLIPVDMTEETVNNFLNNNREVILFESKGTGRYWVKPIQDGENDTKIYYLVCKKTVKFTLESLTLVQSCFEFENPDAPSSQVEITLPAIVSLSGTGNTWQLVKRGRLSFVHPLGES